jgi:hypothetical protein
MYKLCLIQSRFTRHWTWYLQPIEPHDWPFDPDRSKYDGIHLDVRGAIQMAHELVPRNQVSYVYFDRTGLVR